jgi:mRNA interferase MazF
MGGSIGMDAKDYKVWMPVKADVHNKGLRPSGFHKGEIWVCNIGENVGFENDGKGSRYTRPVLIVQKYSNLTCHIIPLSTTSKRGAFYYEFNGETGRTSVALLTQSRVIDSTRLRRRIGKACKADFDGIREQLRIVLGL